MVKRMVLSGLLALMMVLSSGIAEMQWKQDTPAQRMLKNYIETVNAYLVDHGETPVNSLFEIYNGFAVLGITEEADAETPEGVEITLTMFFDCLDMLELRVSDISRFPVIADAMIQAMYGEKEVPEKLTEITAARAEQADKEPAKSYVEPVDDMNGTMPRIYFAYYPNQYKDGVSWIQMTVVFPLAGEWDGDAVLLGETEVKNLNPDGDASEDFEGYYSTDDYQHYEFFTTPTPEPDSAAAEYDFR